MEKNSIRPVKVGKGVRMSYSKQKEVLEMPNLIAVQTDSYKWFLEEGLNEVFRDISPISDYNGNLSLEFVGFELCKDEVKYSIEACKERDATYAAPLKVKVRLHNKETEEISEHDIFMGDLPLMTAVSYTHLMLRSEPICRKIRELRRQILEKRSATVFIKAVKHLEKKVRRHFR